MALEVPCEHALQGEHLVAERAHVVPCRRGHGAGLGERTAQLHYYSRVTITTVTLATKLTNKSRHSATFVYRPIHMLYIIGSTDLYTATMHVDLLSKNDNPRDEWN